VIFRFYAFYPGAPFKNSTFNYEKSWQLQK